MPHYRWEQVPLEEHVVLRSAGYRLHEEFDGEFGHDTISKLLHATYVDLQRRAKVEAWIPLFAERYTREQLWAYSRGHGSERDPRPHVLFLCTHNAGRSLAAMGFFRALAGDDAVCWSAGSHPADALNANMVEAMHEIGIDLMTEFPKDWTPAIVDAADVIVSMDCAEVPHASSARVLEWEIEDPVDLDLAGARRVRDAVRTQVEGLIAELGLESTTALR